jgi:hypothetical protein
VWVGTDTDDDAATYRDTGGDHDVCPDSQPDGVSNGDSDPDRHRHDVPDRQLNPRYRTIGDPYAIADSRDHDAHPRRQLDAVDRPVADADHDVGVGDHDASPGRHLDAVAVGHSHTNAATDCNPPANPIADADAGPVANGGVW